MFKFPAPKSPQFTIPFADGRFSPAVRLDPESDPKRVVELFGLLTPRPTLFISGGASFMSQEEIERTRQLIEDGIARFAAEQGLTVIDGGTEAGVMQMIGEARMKYHYKFPLIGVAPYRKVLYPGSDNPDSEAVPLQMGHSHFVLVDGDEWGAESPMIVNLTRHIATPRQPMIGILINGGKIAEHDVYLATAKSDPKIPMIVLEGSGRKADEIGSAVRTGKTSSHIIRAIVQGGDIRLIAIQHGAEALYAALKQHFTLTPS